MLFFFLQGCFRIYETPLILSYVVDPFLPASNNSKSLFAGLPDNKPTKVLVRVYVVEVWIFKFSRALILVGNSIFEVLIQQYPGIPHTNFGGM